MSWLEDLHKELEVSRLHPVRKKKDWEIERDMRLKQQSKYAAKCAGDKNVKSGHIKNLCVSNVKLSDDLVIAIKEYYNSDMSIVADDVAKKFGLSKGRIALVIQEKVKPNVGPKVREEREPMMTCSVCGQTTNKGNIIRYHNEKCKNINIHLVIQMYQTGSKAKDIMNTFGISEWKFRDIIRKYKSQTH
jgi:hypothetical protein